MSEHQELKAQLEQLTIKAKNAEAENKMLVDRWMLQKMQDAERLNEVWYICCYSYMKTQNKLYFDQVALKMMIS